MIPKESRKELALDTFIKAHPHLLEEMKELSAEDRQQQILWAGNSRGFSRGSVYNRAGQLVASVTQEGLIRHRKDWA